MQLKTRGNKQIWKIAEFCDGLFKASEDQVIPFRHTSERYRNMMYDKAKMLSYAFAYNAFTGPDNHD